MPGTKTNWYILQDGLDNNDLAKVKAGAGSDLAGTKRYYDACMWAIKYGRYNVLDALLTVGGGFDFDGTKKDFAVLIPFHDKSDARIENRNLAIKLIATAYASPNAEDMLLILYKNRNKGNLYDFKPLATSDFITADAPVTLLKACLESDPYAFKTCLETAGFASTEKFVFIMAHATEKNAEYLSNQLLILSARGAEGDYDRVMMLMANSLSSQYKYTGPLTNAALRGDRQMVELLLSRAPLAKDGAAILKDLKKRKADPGIIDAIEKVVTRAPREEAKPSAPAPAAHPPAEFKKTNDPFIDSLITAKINAAAAKKAKAPTPAAPVKTPEKVIEKAPETAPAKAVEPVTPQPAPQRDPKKIYLKKQPPKQIMLPKV